MVSMIPKIASSLMPGMKESSQDIRYINALSIAVIVIDCFRQRKLGQDNVTVPPPYSGLPVPPNSSLS